MLKKTQKTRKTGRLGRHWGIEIRPQNTAQGKGQSVLLLCYKQLTAKGGKILILPFIFILNSGVI